MLAMNECTHKGQQIQLAENLKKELGILGFLLDFIVVF